MTPTAGLTQNQEHRLIRLLEKVQQPYSSALTEALGRVMPVVAIECVVLRFNCAQPQVLLLRRSLDDQHWPGLLHCPGTLLRESDTSPDTALNRLAEGELNGKLTHTHYVGQQHRLNFGRASVLQLIYAATRDADPTAGEWFDIDALPEDIVREHRGMIVQAALSFEP